MSTLQFITPLSLITLIIWILIQTLSTTPPPTKDKTSPFECGFDPLSKSRSPFSSHFFLLAVIFLVFDVELALIIATPILMAAKPTTLYALPLVLFLVVLITGLYHEWNEGTLSWKRTLSYALTNIVQSQRDWTNIRNCSRMSWYGRHLSKHANPSRTRPARSPTKFRPTIQLYRHCPRLCYNLLPSYTHDNWGVWKLTSPPDDNHPRHSFTPIK